VAVRALVASLAEEPAGSALHDFEAKLTTACADVAGPSRP
jgi:hypothetical protein